MGPEQTSVCAAQRNSPPVGISMAIAGWAWRKRSFNPQRDRAGKLLPSDHSSTSCALATSPFPLRPSSVSSPLCKGLGSSLGALTSRAKQRHAQELGPVNTNCACRVPRAACSSDSGGMEITRAQFEQIEDCLPTQRGNVSLSNLQVLNAILYVAEHGCKWRGLACGCVNRP